MINLLHVIPKPPKGLHMGLHLTTRSMEKGDTLSLDMKQPDHMDATIKVDCPYCHQLHAFHLNTEEWNDADLRVVFPCGVTVQKKVFTYRLDFQVLATPPVPGRTVYATDEKN